MTDLHLAVGGSPYVYDTTSEGGDLRDSSGTLLLHSPLVVRQSDGSFIALLSVASFDIDAQTTLSVIGSKPLLVASWSTLTIAGFVDVGSHTTEIDATAHIQQPTQIGAGADLQCTNLAGVVGTDAVLSGGSGGGGGGGFQGVGGAGAVGDTGCTSAPCPRPGGPGGMTLGATPTVIRGGCSGAASGAAGPGVTAPATATTVSAGGAGGGALQLAARLTMTIAGQREREHGSAGAGAPTGSACGGGGGGAGGYLGLDAPAVMVSGTVAANGGGGGGSAPFADFGNVGTDGEPTATPASGGAAYGGGTCGLAGAPGAAGADPTGMTATGNDACGGGGGGGGGGFVLYWTPSLNLSGATVSPPAQAGP